MFENGKVNPNYITYGETVALYPVYRTGYSFVGWYDAKEGGARVEVIDESQYPEHFSFICPVQAFGI